MTEPPGERGGVSSRVLVFERISFAFEGIFFLRSTNFVSISPVDPDGGEHCGGRPWCESMWTASDAVTRHRAPGASGRSRVRRRSVPAPREQQARQSENRAVRLRACVSAARARSQPTARAHLAHRVPCPPSARSLSLARRYAQATLQRSNSSMTPARLSNSRPPPTARAWRASRVTEHGSTTWCGVQRETSISP